MDIDLEAKHDEKSQQNDEKKPMQDNKAIEIVTQPSQNGSKLENLSREDLIKIVKKQLQNQKESKKQLETAKKNAKESGEQVEELRKKLEQQESGRCAGEGTNGMTMLTIELNDYKNAIGIVRKELQESRDRLSQRDSLVEELSQRIAQLQQEKEEIHEELRKKLAEENELRNAMEEKSKVIAENSKEISSLLVQLNELRQAMQDEIGTQQEQLRQQSQQLMAEQRAESARTAELRRLRCENETLVERMTGLEEEFNAYKMRAEFALKSTKNNSEISPDSPNVDASKTAISDEVNQLVDLLRQRNAEISQLSTKCSFLEEEVRSAQSHSKTLVDELNALHDSIEARRQAQLDRQRFGRECEQRLKTEEIKRGELEQELREAREREMQVVTGAAQTEMKLRLELERMCKELEEAKQKINSSTNNEEKLKGSPRHSKQRPQSGPRRLLKKMAPPLHISSSSNAHSANDGGGGGQTICLNDSLELGDATTEVGELGGMNSESSDSLEDLQSILHEAEIAPTSDVPTFNVASLASLADDDASISTSRMIQFNAPYAGSLMSEEQFYEIQKQLADSRDLLSESEETNVRLTEQINVLKEEIRRLERNQKRAEKLGNGVCSEYFKNIVLKFLAPPKVNDERIQLLPVLRTILHLDESELQLVRQSCAASQLQSTSTQQQQNSAMTADDAANGGSLLDWSSLFGWK